MTSAPQITRDQLLVVNVRGRWREVRRGEATAEQVVLGDWNLADRDIDPNRIAVVLGTVEGTIVRAQQVTGHDPADGYDRPRVRFRPGTRLPHLEDQPSPYRWQRGELYPAVALALTELPGAPGPVAGTDLGATGTVTIGGYTLHVDEQTATISVPPGRPITVTIGEHTQTLMLDEITAIQPVHPEQVAELARQGRKTTGPGPGFPATLHTGDPEPGDG
jgi:hypothetical protein